MEFVILNAIIYLVTLIAYWRLKRKLDLGFIVLLAFTVIAILGIPNYYIFGFINYNRNISLLPFLYLYVILLFFIRPYLNVKQILIDKIEVHNHKKLELIIFLFIISSIFSIYILLPVALNNIKSGEWNQIRNELYNDDLIKSYGNFFERIMLIFNQYFRLISILIFFYLLTIKKYSSKIIILLGLSCIIPTILISVCTASRGMTINLLMEFAAGFILFKNQIPIKVRKLLYLFSGLFVSIILFYSLIVTISRFSSNSGANLNDLNSNLSLLDYFGQPMLTFNSGVASMHDYAYGKYFFKYILDALSINSSFNEHQLGGNWNNGFFTFIGGFYIDFGPIGTFLIALILPYFIKKNIKGKVIPFENLYLYYFFFIFFLEGVFVTGVSSIISWLFTILIYLFLKVKIHE